MNKYLNTKYFTKNFIWLDKTNSTNSYIKKNIYNLQNKTIVATLNQTKARGTKNRKFYCIPNKTLGVSILIKNVKILTLAKIPIAFSVAVANALKNLHIKNITIKWFNDILIDDKKVAGILCESLIEKNADVIIGIGINLYTTKQEFETQNLLNACSIFSQTNKLVYLNSILKNLTKEFEIIYSKLFTYDSKKHYKYILNTYKKYCCTLGKYVKIVNIKTKNFTVAKAIDISKYGNLICMKNEQLFEVNYNTFSIQPITLPLNKK